MQKYVALVSYVGTSYCGWQKQKNSFADQLPSIQETIEKAIQKLTEENTNIIGSGRTDAGVHATGQVFHFTLKKKRWDENRLFLGLNSLLPITVRILSVKKISENFHAQKSAAKKQYSYYFQQGPSALPHYVPYSYWIKKKLNISAMNSAAKDLLGEHDFLPFRASGSTTKGSIRTIFEAGVTQKKIEFCETDEFTLIQLKVVGNGFLKQMVRSIAGTLLQVGEGKRESNCIRKILRSKDRKDVGPTAPSRALWLEKVWYEEIDNWFS